MNQNRCWPGVPNRYRTRPASSVTRPKSIATVVVVLSGTCDRSSTLSEAAVITASVVSGVISDTEPTNVVLPTPKPPATMIFTEVISESSASGAPETISEPAKSTKYPFQQLDVRTALRVVELVDSHQAIHRHVGDEDPCHSQRHLQYRRDLGHRPPAPAELQDRLALRAEPRMTARVIARGRDHRLDLQLIPRLGPPPRDRVRPD
jgi:hypothetical protein